MNLLRIYIGSFAVAVSASLSAQPPLYDLLELLPGKPHPDGVEIESSGAPVDEYLAPLPEVSPYSMFQDYTVQILKAEGTIYAVHASRAYSDSSVCKDEEQTLRTLVEQRFPSYSYDESQMMYNGPEGDLAVQLGCSKTLGAPFYKLSLRFFSRSSGEKLINDLLKQSER